MLKNILLQEATLTGKVRWDRLLKYAEDGDICMLTALYVKTILQFVVQFEKFQKTSLQIR